jgi:hypothetical protein
MKMHQYTKLKITRNLLDCTLDVSKKVKKKSITIDMIIKNTPPSLVGLDRKTA